MKPERRTLHFPLELRVKREEGKPPRIEGFAARFNTLSEDLGGWKETIASGAFKDVLTDDVRCLFNHDVNIILGRSTAKTLKYEERNEGLWMECELPDTEQARAVAVAIERGDVTGQSFSFALPPYPEGRIWEEADGMFIRTITRVARLYDVGPVVFPAYPDTDVDVRTLEEARTSAIEEARAALRSAAPNFDHVRKRLDMVAAEN